MRVLQRNCPLCEYSGDVGYFDRAVGRPRCEPRHFVRVLRSMLS